MPVLQSLARTLRRAANKISGSPGGLSVSSYLSGQPYEPDVSYLSLVKKYQGYVYACASRNATACASIPLRLFQMRGSYKEKTGQYPTRRVKDQRLQELAKSPTTEKYLRKAVEIVEVTEGHPLIDLLQKVNPHMNSFDLHELTVLSQELVGNAYWFLLVDAMGVPTEIWPLMPQFMKVVADRDKYITAYKYGVDTVSTETFRPDEIIHYRYMSITNGVYGVGPLEAAILAADLHYNMNVLETSIMKNRGRPDQALVLPADAGSLSPDTRKRLRQEWFEKFGGPRRGGKLAILEGGAELKDLTPSPREMNFLTGRKASRAEIAAIFGVPESKISVEDVNRANAEAGNYTYAKDTILPRLRRYEEKLNERLVPLYSDRFFLAFDNPVPQDKEYRLKQVKDHLSTGYSTINEERDLDDLPPVPWGDTPILPMTMMPMGTAPTQTPPAPKASKVVGKAPRRLPPLGHPTNFKNDPLADAIGKWYAARERELNAVFARYDTLVERSVKAPVDDLVGGWVNIGKWLDDLDKAMAPFMRFTLYSGATRALKDVAPTMALNPLNPRIATALESHRVGALRNIIDTTAREIRHEIAAGLNAGENTRAIRTRLSRKFTELETHRASLIARTETIWAWNEGATIGWAESNVVSAKVWVSSEDDRSCDFCPQMNGKVIELEDSFWRKGDAMTVTRPDGTDVSLDFAYEDVGHPPLHPNCRCAVAAELREL